MEYLGTLGRLVAVDCSSSQTMARASRYAPRQTLEGVVKVQRRLLTRRKWSIRVGVADGPARAALDGFVRGDWGPGPWLWLPVDALHGNALHAASTDVRDATLAASGPVADAAGRWQPASFASTYTGSSGALLARDVPVLPGKPVTFAIDAEGRIGQVPSVAVRFSDLGGAIISTAFGYGTGSTMQRVSVTATAPAGAVSARIYLMSTVAVAAAPQVTWTAGRVPYYPPAACPMAVVDLESASLLTAVRGERVLSDLSYTITEVG